MTGLVSAAPVEALEHAMRELATIKAEADDDEVAHQREDDLRAWVLRWVAVHAPDEIAAVARVAIQTAHVEFARWYS